MKRTLKRFLNFLGVFALLQAVAISNYLKNFLTKSEFKYFFFMASSVAAGLVFLTVVGLTWAGVIAPWSGRYENYISHIEFAYKASQSRIKKLYFK